MYSTLCKWQSGFRPVTSYRWGYLLLTAVVLFLQLNADIYETDPELEKIRKEQGYSYMDIITIHKDTLPNYEEKVTCELYTVAVHLKWAISSNKWSFFSWDFATSLENMLRTVESELEWSEMSSCIRRFYELWKIRIILDSGLWPLYDHHLQSLA